LDKAAAIANHASTRTTQLYEIVARIGGDEFAVNTALALDGITANENAIELGSWIVSTVGEPVYVDQTVITHPLR